MADPISIISLLGTAATATKAALRYASAVRKAPKELEMLNHELESLHHVLQKLMRIAESEESREDFADFSPLFQTTAVCSIPCVLLSIRASDHVIYQDLVVTLENTKRKLENKSTAKGLEKVYDRLKWPADGPDIQVLLQAIRRDTQIFQFALTMKGTRTLSQIMNQGSEMLSSSQRYVACSNLQNSNAIHKLSQSFIQSNGVNI